MGQPRPGLEVLEHGYSSFRPRRPCIQVVPRLVRTRHASLPRLRGAPRLDHLRPPAEEESAGSMTPAGGTILDPSCGSGTIPVGSPPEQCIVGACSALKAASGPTLPGGPGRHV